MTSIQLTPSDSRWPLGLRDLPDPPAALNAIGRVEWLARPTLAIVGARKTTPTGVELATRFARELAEAGWVIVSGLARGIDSAAHVGALDAGGGTVAVLGTGLDVVYPPGAGALHGRVAASGLLISEFDPGTPPLRHHFPRRNRIIAALSRAVLVVEGAARSGSRITADLGLDLGREVMAVPRDPVHPGAETPNALIAAGAVPATSPRAVAEHLGECVPAAPPPTPPRQPPIRLAWILAALDHQARPAQSLLEMTGRRPADMLPGLLELELDGWVERDDLGRYRRRDPDER